MIIKNLQWWQKKVHCRKNITEEKSSATSTDKTDKLNYAYNNSQTMPYITYKNIWFEITMVGKVQLVKYLSDFT